MIGATGWPRISAYRKQIDDVVGRVDALISAGGTVDPELTSDLAKYITVLSAGLIENTMEEVVLEYGRQFRDTRMDTYLAGRMRSFNNPQRNRILDVLSSFDGNWGLRAKAFLAVNATHTVALESIMSNRHQIAHGGFSGVTLGDIRRWLLDVEPIVQFLWLLVLSP